MQTFLDTVHTVQVFYCDSDQFDQTAFWQKIIDILYPLTSKSVYDPVVIPNVYNTATENWVVFNNLQWNGIDAKKWSGAGNKGLRLEKIAVYFPSMEHCYEEKITPDIFLKASVKATEKETRYAFVFMLALKNTFIKKIGQKEAEAVLAKLQEFLLPVFKIKKERAWALKESELEYRDFLHDLFPSVILANGNDFVFRDGYQDWA